MHNVERDDKEIDENFLAVPFFLLPGDWPGFNDEL